MAFSKLRSITLAFTLLGPSIALAWEEVPCCEPFMAIEDHNLQWFEPVEVDLGCELYEHNGFYFKYDKLYWATTGERTTIGDPNVVVMSEDIFPVNPQDDDNFNMAPEPYQVINGIQNAPPHAVFAWGDRYEGGYTCDGRGWSIGVLDGPEAISTQYYGFQIRETPTLIEDPDFPVPVFRDLLTGYVELDPETGQPLIDPLTNMPIPTLTPFGWGSIHVNFTVPHENFLKGFRDYHDTTQDLPDDVPEAGRWVVFHGPGGTGAFGQVTDGLPDDIDEDGFNGFGVFFIAGNPVYFTDFDDLHLFNIRFNSMIVRNYTETDGIELMRTHVIDNSHKMKKHQHRHFELGYGVRYLRLRDRFTWEGYSDLGDADVGDLWFTDFQTDNNIVGPQVRLRYEDQRGKWRLGLDGRALFGWNIQNADLEGGLGFTVNPGALNNPVIMQPTYFDYGRREDSFAPVGELRADLGYQITSAIELKLGYTMLFVDSISRSASTLEYSLPNMGMTAASKQEIFINGVNFGIEINH